MLKNPSIASSASKNAISILFDLSKKEICDPESFKKLLRKLKQNYTISVSKDEITLDRLRPYQLAILGCPREPFSAEEFTALKKYMDEGGCLMVISGEGGEARHSTNINYFIEQYGISINDDAVLRTCYYKYLHPKEVFVSNGILNKEIVRAARGIQKSPAKADMDKKQKLARRLMETKDEFKIDNSGLNFVYPYGASLNVQKPAFPLLSSGPISYPMNRPLCATYVHGKEKKAKLVVIGSVKYFDDEFFDKEDNNKIAVLFIYMTLLGRDF